MSQHNTAATQQRIALHAQKTESTSFSDRVFEILRRLESLRLCPIFVETSLHLMTTQLNQNGRFQRLESKPLESYFQIDAMRFLVCHLSPVSCLSKAITGLFKNQKIRWVASGSTQNYCATPIIEKVIPQLTPDCEFDGAINLRQPYFEPFTRLIPSTSLVCKCDLKSF